MRKVAFVQNVTAFNYSEESRFLNILTEVKKKYVSTSVIIRFWCNEHHLGYFCSPPKIKGTAFLTALCNTIFQYRITFYAYSNTFTLLLHGWFLIAKLNKKCLYGPYIFQMKDCLINMIIYQNKPWFNKTKLYIINL